MESLRDELRPVKNCLWCGKKLHNRIDGMYCSLSHKGLAYKHRRSLRVIEEQKQAAIKQQAYENRSEIEKATDRYLESVDRYG